MSQATPRPHISSDKSYIDAVTALLKTRERLEDVPYERVPNLLNELGIHTDVFGIIDDESLSLEEKNKKLWEVVDAGFAAVNAAEPTPKLRALLKELWEYLAEEDPLEKADLIYVFGGISEPAVQEAIRLKKEGYAPKIMFSGKRASYMKDGEMTEAEKYARMAVAEGISREDIILEDQAVNTPENIVFSAKILKESEDVPKVVIAVSIPYHMKRGSLTMRAGFDWNFKLIRHPGPSAKYTAENYFKDMNGWSYIILEYLKLYMSQKMKHF